MAVRVVVAAHGDLPEALHSSAQMIMGQIDRLGKVCLRPGMGLAEFTSQLSSQLDPDGTTLILTDLRGGTPDNAARLLARRHPDVKVISNITLGVLLEVLLHSDLDLDALDELCQLAGPCVAGQE